MPTPSHGSAPARVLPPRPNLEHLKNEAKQRLDQLRAANPAAQLAQAQFQLAREYGFASWRELKATIDGRVASAGHVPDPVGDWIGVMETGDRSALHIRRLESGALHATMDVPSGGYFDDPVDALSIEGDRLSFTIMVRSVNALYRGEWDRESESWVGVWTNSGLDFPISFVRGVIPPAPTIEGLDGLWDGTVESGERKRLSFLIKTDRHGTRAWCDSPDSQVFNVPAKSISREGDGVSIAMHSFVIEGEIDPAGEQIRGRFIRGDAKPVLNLTRRAPGAAAPRGPLPQAIELPPEALAIYEGGYGLAAGAAPARLVVEQGRLYVLATGQPRIELVPTSPTIFFCREIEAEVRFEFDGDRVDALVMSVRGHHSRLKRVG